MRPYNKAHLSGKCILKYSSLAFLNSRGLFLEEKNMKPVLEFTHYNLSGKTITASCLVNFLFLLQLSNGCLRSNILAFLSIAGCRKKFSSRKGNQQLARVQRPPELEHKGARPLASGNQCDRGRQKKACDEQSSGWNEQAKNLSHLTFSMLTVGLTPLSTSDLPTSKAKQSKPKPFRLRSTPTFSTHEHPTDPICR